MIRLEFPLHIEIKLTNACNLNCIHCIANAGSKKSNELKKEEIFKVIDEAKENKAFNIGLTGGEPFLREDIFEIIDYVYKSNIPLILTTNGTLLNEGIINRIKEKVSLVRVSLDHFIPAKHDAFRGTEGVFEETVKTLHILLRYERFFQTTVLTVISKYNFKYILKIIDYLESLEVKSANLFLFAPGGRGLLNKNKLSLGKKKVAQFCNIIEKEIKERKKIKIHTNNPLMAIVRKEEINSICPAAISSCFITEEGRVLPCPYFYTLPNKEDNIRYKKLKDIWLKSAYFEEIRKETSLASKCSSCEFKNSCFGGCRAGAFNKYGTIKKPDPMCWI